MESGPHKDPVCCGTCPPSPHGDTVYVAVSRELLVDMAGNGLSDPLVLVGIKTRSDGAYELLLRRPSRAELQVEIGRRFRSAERADG